MDGSESPRDELLGGFDFLGDIDPVLWDELNSREPGSSSDNNFTFEAAAPTLRCVDATHNSATCTKCTACPPAELAHKYELMGEDGKKNGLKRLRSLLTRTREWRSSDARDAAAAALQSVSPRAAEALRTRHSSMMSKELAFAVLGFWGYKSDVWQKRGNRVVHSHEEEAAAATSAHPPPATETRESAVAALWMMLGTQLRPLSLQATRMLAGADACAHAKLDEDAARLYVGELPLVRRLSGAVLSTMVPVLSAWLAEARAAEESYATEVLLLQSGAPDAMPVAATQPAPLRVESLLSAGVAYFSSPERENVFQLHAGASKAVAVWHAEWAESQRTSCLLCSKLSDTLAQSRAHSPSLYAAAAAMVCEFLTAHFAAIAGALNQRIAWLAAAATALGLPANAEPNTAASEPQSGGCEAFKTPMSREFPAFLYCPTLGLSFMNERANSGQLCGIAAH